VAAVVAPVAAEGSRRSRKGSRSPPFRASGSELNDACGVEARMSRTGVWLAAGVSAVVLFAPAVFALPQDVFPQFDVASVKPNRSDAPASSRFPLGPGDAFEKGNTFVVINQPLSVYIRFAFGRSQGEQLRVPAWVNDERFDVQARAPGDPTKNDMRLMVRDLLVRRFKMAWHIERPEQAVFELVAASAGRLGPQLTRHGADAPCGSDPKFVAIPCGSAGLVSANGGGRGTIAGRAEPISRLAALLSNNGFAGIDRVVLDRTGIAGDFDFTLEFALPRASLDAGPAATSDDSGPALGTALREQLGLIMRSTRAPVDVPVIDRIERPTPD